MTAYHGESYQPRQHHRTVKTNKSKNGEQSTSSNKSSFLPAMHAFEAEESYRNRFSHEQTSLKYIPAMQHSVIPTTQGGEDEEDHDTLPSAFKSRSIPIQKSGIKRTPSELKLREDQELADYRDYVMFRRIVDRLSKQQQEIQDHRLRKENDMCLAHVIGIRNGSEDNDTTTTTTHHHHESSSAIYKRYILSDLAPPRHAAPLQPPSFATALHPNLQQQQEEDEMFELEL